MLVFKMLTYVEYAPLSHTSQALKILFLYNYRNHCHCILFLSR